MRDASERKQRFPIGPRRKGVRISDDTQIRYIIREPHESEPIIVNSDGEALRNLVDGIVRERLADLLPKLIADGVAREMQRLNKSDSPRP
jgi:hypothetical protein